MNLYIDTEFNGYKGELISMALVDESGQEWYEVLACTKPDKWVAENVMPVLGQKAVDRREMQSSLLKFLWPYSAIHVIADWPDDIRYFCELLITGPGARINTPRLTMEVRRDIDSSRSLVPHNALADARALRVEALK